MTYLSNRQRHAEREERRVQRAEREGSAGKLLERVPDLTKLDFTIMLTVQTMNYLHSGGHRVAL